MARPKPIWRRVLNARFLRWWFTCQAVRIFPVLGRRLAFFPHDVDMIEGADVVLVDERGEVSPSDLADDMAFLRLCQAHDSHVAELQLPNGVIEGRRTALFDNAWIDAANASVLLPDVARTVLVRGARANWNATSARWSRESVRVHGRAFAPLVTQNYFHMLLENGVRLIDLLESGIVGDQPLTVVKQADRTVVEATMFSGIAGLYPDVSIRHVPENALVVPDQAVVHFPRNTYWEWPPVTRDLTGRLTEVFENQYGDTARALPDAVYLSRRGAKLRNPPNAEELVDALANAGIPEFVANDANHAEQIARFRAARTVIAVHGAGLANLIFCRPGTRVVEIFPKNFIKSTYWWLARRLDLRYRPLIAGSGDYDQNFDVDVADILAALQED